MGLSSKTFSAFTRQIVNWLTVYQTFRGENHWVETIIIMMRTCSGGIRVTIAFIFASHVSSTKKIKLHGIYISIILAL